MEWTAGKPSSAPTASLFFSLRSRCPRFGEGGGSFGERIQGGQTLGGDSRGWLGSMCRAGLGLRCGPRKRGKVVMTVTLWVVPAHFLVVELWPLVLDCPLHRRFCFLCAANYLRCHCWWERNMPGKCAVLRNCPPGRVCNFHSYFPAFSPPPSIVHFLFANMIPEVTTRSTDW